MIRKANLSVVLFVKVDEKDFGRIDLNFAQHFHETLFSRSLREVLQCKFIAFTESACRRCGWYFSLRCGLSACSCCANLFLLLRHLNFLFHYSKLFPNNK